MDTSPLFIYSPGYHDNGMSSLSRIMQRCPSCSSDLIQHNDKYERSDGMNDHDHSSDSAVMSGSPGDRGSSPEHRTSGGWHCTHCNLTIHLISNADSLPLSLSPSGYNTNNSNAFQTPELMVMEAKGLSKLLQDQLNQRRSHLNKCKQEMESLIKCHSSLAQHLSSLDYLENQLTTSAALASNSMCVHCAKIRRVDMSTQTYPEKPWHSTRMESATKSTRLAATAVPEVRSILPNKSQVLRSEPHKHNVCSDKQTHSIESRQRKRPAPLIMPARSYEILNDLESPKGSSLEGFIARNQSLRGGQIPEPMSPVVRSRDESMESQSNHKAPPTVPPRNYKEVGPQKNQKDASPPQPERKYNYRSHSEERQLDPRRRPIHYRSQSEERMLDSNFPHLDSVDPIEFMAESRATSTPKSSEKNRTERNTQEPSSNFDRQDFSRFSARDPRRGPITQYQNDTRSRSEDRDRSKYRRSKSGNDLLNDNPYMVQWGSGNEDRLLVTQANNVKGQPSVSRGYDVNLKSRSNYEGISSNSNSWAQQNRQRHREPDINAISRSKSPQEVTRMNDNRPLKPPRLGNGVVNVGNPIYQTNIYANETKNQPPKPQQPVPNGSVRNWDKRSNNASTDNQTSKSNDLDTSSEAGFPSRLFKKPAAYHGVSESRKENIPSHRTRLWDKPKLRS